MVGWSSTPDPKQNKSRTLVAPVQAVQETYSIGHLPSNTVIRDVKGERSILLRFTHSGEEANFKFDPKDLTWDFEAANRTPAFKLFALARSGAYELRFHMWWGTGACESPQVGNHNRPMKAPEKWFFA